MAERGCRGHGDGVAAGGLTGRAITLVATMGGAAGRPRPDDHAAEDDPGLGRRRVQAPRREEGRAQRRDRERAPREEVARVGEGPRDGHPAAAVGERVEQRVARDGQRRQDAGPSAEQGGGGQPAGGGEGERVARAAVTEGVVVGDAEREADPVGVGEEPEGGEREARGQAAARRGEAGERETDGEVGEGGHVPVVAGARAGPVQGARRERGALGSRPSSGHLAPERGGFAPEMSRFRSLSGHLTPQPGSVRARGVRIPGIFRTPRA